MRHDATSGLDYSYDQENRITGAAGYTYTYDVDGNRVEKSNGTTGTIYWYMSPGIVAESDLTGALKSEYVFFDGERVARKDFPINSVFYYFSDHLKTASVITDSAGNIKEDEDFYPWGGELQFVNNDSNHYKFTSKERDSETGLDYFEARYYANALSRFTSPDPIHFQASMLRDPQRFNLYAYVRNNPLAFIDPKGEAIRLPDDEQQRKKTLDALKSQVGDKAGAYLYDNVDKKTGDHYVGIYKNGPDGKGPDFTKLGAPAVDVNAIIQNSQVVQAAVVPNGTVVHDDSGGTAMVGSLYDHQSPGITYMENGVVKVAILDPSTDPGKLPGSVMSDGKPGDVDQGILIGHELGHVAFQMRGVFLWSPSDTSNKSALDLENDVRKSRNPAAATRTEH